MSKPADPANDVEVTRQVMRALQRNGYSCFLMGYADRPQDSLRASLSFLRAIQTGDELQLAQVLPPIRMESDAEGRVDNIVSSTSVEPHREVGPSGMRLVGVPEGLGPEEIDRLPTVAVFPYQEAKGRPPIYQPALPLPPEEGDLAREKHMVKERNLNQAREFIGADDPLRHQTEPIPPLRIGFVGNTGAVPLNESNI